MNGKIFIIERVAVRNELHPAIAPVLEGLTYLEVNDDEDDKDSGHQVADVRCVLPIEGLLQGIELVRFCEQEVEKSDDCTLKLGTLLGTNGDRRETLPQDDLTDICGDEEGDTTSETVALLEQLIKEDDDDTGERKLEDDDDAIDKTNIVDRSVHAREQVSESLTDGDDN